MDSRFEQFVQFALIALYSVRRIRTSRRLVFHTIYAGIFYPCYLLLHFLPLQVCPYRIFHSRIFSRPKKPPQCTSRHFQISKLLSNLLQSMPDFENRSGNVAEVVPCFLVSCRQTYAALSNQRQARCNTASAAETESATTWRSKQVPTMQRQWMTGGRILSFGNGTLTVRPNICQLGPTVQSWSSFFVSISSK